MKTFQMTIFLLVLSFAFIVDPSVSMNLKNNESRRKHIIIDNGQAPLQLTTVVRRNPTVTAVHTVAPTRTAVSDSVSFGNTNSNNGGASPLGRTATIVNPSIVLHQTSTMHAIKETPAHVGWRNEKKTITSLNKQTGHVEQHVVNSKVPLVGMVQEVKPLKVHHTRRYDITNNKLGPISTSISE